MLSRQLRESAEKTHSPLVPSPLSQAERLQSRTNTSVTTVESSQDVLLPSSIPEYGEALASKMPAVMKSGWLYRRSHRQWKRRWFVLRDAQLTFYKDEREYKAEGIIMTADIMSAAVVSQGHSGGNPTKFAVYTSGDTLQFKADNGVDVQSWIEVIRQAAAQSEEASSYTRVDASGFAGYKSNKPNIYDHVIREGGEQEQEQGQEQGGISFPADFRHHSHNKGDGIVEPLASPSAFSGSFEGFSSSGASEEHLPLPVGTSGEASGEEHSALTAETNTEPEKTVESGYLLRHRKHYGKWVKQYAVITSLRVLFYKRQDDTHPVKVLPVSAILDVMDIDPMSKSKQYCFQIITAEKRLKFSVESEERLTEWLAGLKLVSH